MPEIAPKIDRATYSIDEPDSLKKAVNVLKKGGLAVIPTDTVYGLAALASSPKGRARLVQLKIRPPEKPIGFLVSSSLEPALGVESLGVEVSAEAESLMQRYWPGQLTLVLKRHAIKKPATKDQTPGTKSLPLEPEFGLETMGVRCPDHKWLLELLQKTGPLAATSANLHAQPTARNISDLPSEILNGVDILIDGGMLSETASTVIDLTTEEPQTLRAGKIKIGGSKIGDSKLESQ